MNTDDRYCPSCRQTVKPTRGAFLLTYLTALTFISMAMMSVGGLPGLNIAVLLTGIVAATAFMVTGYFFPEGACPNCKSRNLAERAPD